MTAGPRSTGRLPAVLATGPLRVYSLRRSVLVVVVLVTFAPLFLVSSLNWFEIGVEGRMRGRVRRSAEEAVAALDRGSDAVRAVARAHSVRVRVVDRAGWTRLDADHEDDAKPWRWLGEIVYGPEGPPSLRAFDEALGPIRERPEVRAARSAGRTVVGCRAASPAGQRLVCHAARSEAGPAGRLVYVQESARPSRRDIRSLYELRFPLLRVLVVVLPIALALGFWLSRSVVRPIEKLRRQALDKASRAAPGGDLTLRRRDELGDLTEAFNALLGALDDRARAHEAFLADLAHELKNPVAAVRAAAESLQDGPVSPERVQRLAAVLGESSGRLDALVAQFLELARAEAGLRDEPRAPVDVAALADGIVRSFAVDERYRRVRFDRAGCASAVVAGVPDRIEAAIRNLVDNAATFVEEGGHVRVAVEGADGEVTVEVSDDGPGIAEPDLPRVFDRFFTTRGARRGTGLGLALVRAVAHAHGGDVTVRSPPGAGAIFRLVLPGVSVGDTGTGS